MGINLSMALDEGGVDKRAMTDLFVFEVLYLSTADRATTFIRHVFDDSGWSWFVISGFGWLSLETTHSTVEAFSSTIVL